MADGVNRRTFLGVAAVAGGAAAAERASAQDQSLANRVNVAVVGTGGRGTGLAAAYQRIAGVQVTHVCDADRGRAEQAGQTVQKIANRAPQIATDMRRVFDDKAIDAVVIATPNH